MNSIKTNFINVKLIRDSVRWMSVDKRANAFESLTGPVTSGQLTTRHQCLQTAFMPAPFTVAVMADNDESEIIEHHDDEEMEKGGRSRNPSHSLLESVTSSEKEGYSSTQSSHRLLAYSDALIAIIATVMVRYT